MAELKCQCPDIGEVEPDRLGEYDEKTERPFLNHAPGECKCTNMLAQYDRNGVVLWLCSICCVFGDKLIEETVQ